MDITATEYRIGSTEYLGLVAKNDGYILYEKSAPSGRLKRDFISLVTRDRRALALSAPQGFHVCPVELPREIFDDFLAASLIEQEGAEDSDGRIFFRLTAEGRTRAPYTCA